MGVEGMTSADIVIEELVLSGFKPMQNERYFLVAVRNLYCTKQNESGPFTFCQGFDPFNDRLNKFEFPHTISAHVAEAIGEEVPVKLENGLYIMRINQVLCQHTKATGEALCRRWGK
jgi:hypothetical protein